MASAPSLPSYLRGGSYRFNRRNLPDGLNGYLIRRTVEFATITYHQLKTGICQAATTVSVGFPLQLRTLL